MIKSQYIARGSRCEDIIHMIDMGATNTQIAKKYGTSARTISVYRKAHYGALCVLGKDTKDEDVESAEDDEQEEHVIEGGKMMKVSDALELLSREDRMLMIDCLAEYARKLDRTAQLNDSLFGQVETLCMKYTPNGGVDVDGRTGAN